MFFNHLAVASNNQQCQDNQPTVSEGIYTKLSMFIYPLLILLLQSADCHLTQYSTTASVKLLFNGKVVANGIAVEGPMLKVTI